VPVKIVNNTIHSVKGLLYRFSAGKLEFLLTKEADTRMFGFPGGAQDEEDVDIEATAIREVCEELGITKASYCVSDPHITHEFVHEDTNSPRFGKKGVLHILLLFYNGKEQIIPSPEIEEVMWLSEEEVIEKISSSYRYWTPVFKKVITFLNVAPINKMSPRHPQPEKSS
jgi:8-oxo-dGTP pyrophosphatase MutT (NUDIX family)